MRLGTIQEMCKKVLAPERQLHGIVSVRDLVAGTAAHKSEQEKVKAFITENEFLVNNEKVLTILDAIEIDRKCR